MSAVGFFQSNVNPCLVIEYPHQVGLEFDCTHKYLAEKVEAQHVIVNLFLNGVSVALIGRMTLWKSRFWQMGEGLALSGYLDLDEVMVSLPEVYHRLPD